jgi:hypothetical protein
MITSVVILGLGTKTTVPRVPDRRALVVFPKIGYGTKLPVTSRISIQTHK